MILHFLRAPIQDHWQTKIISLLAAMLLVGCGNKHLMMPTPTLYTGPEGKPLYTLNHSDDLIPALDLLFITDRTPATNKDQLEPYTSDRSRSMAFGSTTILFGENITWKELLQQSTTSQRTTNLGLKLGSTRELGHYPPIPYKLAKISDGLTRSPATIDEHEEASRAFQAEISRRLDLHPRKEVVLYVHGFDNSFSDAAMTMGELCHFLGREFVCGIFTWPAGNKGNILSSYNKDYESSVYAADHLRKAIRLISLTPGVEKIHLLAHSRGTDVLVTALSDLNYEAYTQQSNLSKRNKVGNIVLMAPDLDPDVAVAKLFKSLSDPDVPYGPAPNPLMVFKEMPGFNITIYVSPNDKALAASSWLFGDIIRLGSLNKDMLTSEQIQQARMVGCLDLIQVQGSTDRFGHSYFTSNSKVSSDLIALLRYGLRPNDPGRPLKEIEKPFWQIPGS